MDQIYVATTNQGKIREFQEMFQSLDIKMVSLMDTFNDVEDVEETGKTFEENARLKADTYAKTYQIPVMADDSGLTVEALNGEPGIYSARYAGLEKNDDQNLEKLLKNLEGVEQRDAAFVSVIAFARPDEETIVAEGRCEGRITDEPRGSEGFGYDPVFIPNGYEQTMAQLGSTVKNKISHRKHALDAMLKKIKPLL
ncbi:XTP/dITP diphosphatase [Tenuibacillus multivorans]|uniref:dITP/XTP pyrophosphatase n=1 Tax=Tenuibacillus multivorans TaxID=237069 RepID=A0A1G9ZPA9_9BACI|nr:XTP/dITP diphosphatase [Tenuibacillus multivorans]GEL76796.1 non-canonical purine NTP pyrophosphatase [Tenuibacillus multivorans]SDN23050.1 XTP/dITP diphosphohydrolase [Tenuibacillus multivorans]